MLEAFIHQINLHIAKKEKELKILHEIKLEEIKKYYKTNYNIEFGTKVYSKLTSETCLIGNVENDKELKLFPINEYAKQNLRTRNYYKISEFHLINKDVVVLDLKKENHNEKNFI
jgi:hypothetical protein